MYRGGPAAFTKCSRYTELFCMLLRNVIRHVVPDASLHSSGENKNFRFFVGYLAAVGGGNLSECGV